MFGRLLAGFVSNKLGDKRLIRIGAAVELVGIILVFLPVDGYIAAAVGFVIIGTGMGPIYPAIQHMAPNNFGKKYSAAVIGLQMASAYVGSTFMPMLFGKLQQGIGIWIMPIYLLIFAVFNTAFLELSYIAENKAKAEYFTHPVTDSNVSNGVFLHLTWRFCHVTGQSIDIITKIIYRNMRETNGSMRR